MKIKLGLIKLYLNKNEWTAKDTERDYENSCNKLKN